MKKKAVALVLAAAMCVTSLAGCGSSTASTTENASGEVSEAVVDESGKVDGVMYKVGLPQVEEVRGLGLMVACDLAEGVSAPDVVLAGLDEGLLLNFTGPRTLRFLPPLVCSKEDVDVLVQKLAALLS